MIALEKEPMLSRCARRETSCKSRLRQGRSGRVACGRRSNFPNEGAADSARFSASRVSRSRLGETGPAEGAIELYLREVGRVGELTPKAERALAAKAQRGDTRAREDLLKSHLRLVVSIAQEFEGIGLSLFDLIAEGNLGLMKAVTRFDPAKQERLSPLASWWIRQAIKRALAQHARSGCQA